jgi:general secretion pathway protein G
MKHAFTVIELIFVIVILGILSAVALPKFAKNKEMADIGKGKADVATIRAAIINERQKRILKGDNSWISKLSSSNTTLFTGDGTNELLKYGITSSASAGHWSVTANTNDYKHYTYMIGTTACKFVYNATDGSFGLDTNQPATCKKLVQ